MVRFNLSNLGERGAIARIAELASRGGLDIDTSDDCALLELDGQTALLTTDMINEATHIPAGASPRQIGWFAAAVNLSDIAAMGGRPVGMLAALGLPRSTPVKFLDGLAGGMVDCLRAHGALLLGGDTKESDVLTIAGTAVGVPAGRILRRRGAKAGDIVAVTGALGRAAAGLRLAGGGRQRRLGIRLLLEVEPRVKAGMALAASAGVHCCMDISDGLSESVFQLSELNRVSFEIDLGKVPVHPVLARCARRSADAAEAALHGGGDYELLSTVSRKGFEAARRRLARLGVPLTAIGRVRRGRENTLLKSGTIIPLERKGYEHFRWQK